MNVNKEKEDSRNSKNFIKSLDKGLKVIQAFSRENSTMTISEVSNKTNLTRPTVRRILLTLQELRFVDSNNDEFFLTARILNLGYAFLSSQDLIKIAEPFMQKFVKRVGESCSMAVLDKDDIIYIARVPTKRIITITLSVGSRLPAHATSMGQVMLAHLSKEELNDFFSNVNLNKLTNQTLINKTDLLQELEKIRQSGWALAEQELETGLRSIAAPIKNTKGKTVAAINCSTQSSRVAKETLIKEYLPILLQTANDISENLINQG